MDLFYELLNYLKTYDFSIELINHCKDIFQAGGWNQADFEKFSRLFYQKVRKQCPILSDDEINQILRVIYERGCLKLNDILFIDGAAFSEKTIEVYPGHITNYLDFVWESNKYKWCDFLDTTFFFCCTDLKTLDQSFLQKLREEINMIFVKYFHISTFPEKLGMDSAVGQEYAIRAEKEKLVECFLNKAAYDISINCKKKDESTVRKLDITIDPLKERILTITNVDDNIERLSEIINQFNRTNDGNEYKLIRRSSK